MKPRLLDLFCGAGGAAVGYHRAGFEVVGVDIAPQPHYPFEFYQGDALGVLSEPWKSPWLGWPARDSWDAIHASPPCQGYTQLAAVNAKLGRSQRHEKLISETRVLLQVTGLPYIIENVVGSTLINPVRVCGTTFRLPIRRHRLFESNRTLVGTGCEHGRFTEPRYWTSWRPNGEKRLSTVVQVYGHAGGRHEWPAAMGIDWMDCDELSEAIPPAYTEFIGRQLLDQLDPTRTPGV